MIELKLWSVFDVNELVPCALEQLFLCFSSMLTLFTKYLLGFHIIVCFDGSTSHFQFDRYSLCVHESFICFSCGCCCLASLFFRCFVFTYMHFYLILSICILSLNLGTNVVVDVCSSFGNTMLPFALQPPILPPSILSWRTISCSERDWI